MSGKRLIIAPHSFEDQGMQRFQESLERKAQEFATSLDTALWNISRTRGRNLPNAGHQRRAQMFTALRDAAHAALDCVAYASLTSDEGDDDGEAGSENDRR